MVTDNVFSSNFSLPFYHLNSEGFRHLKTFPGTEILLTKSHSIRSFFALKSAVEYAYLNEDLFQLFVEKQSRDILRDTLLSTYFHTSSLAPYYHDYLKNIEGQILNDREAVYEKESTDEEEIFLRGALFKRIVPKIYNYTCCISGMRIVASNDIQMIDACHILPFSESKDDTITNGLSLCPNLHRAFDRGLLSIDDNYRVLVKDNLIENGDASYLIKSLNNKQILLPKDQGHFPALNKLQQHRKRWKFH